MPMKTVKVAEKFGNNDPKTHRTSIGSSFNTRPKNKRKQMNFKRYRGQGK